MGSIRNHSKSGANRRTGHFKQRKSGLNSPIFNPEYLPESVKTVLKAMHPRLYRDLLINPEAKP